jgi:hypothetical protein
MRHVSIRVIASYSPIAEIAHQQVTRRGTEGGWRDGQAPGCIQFAIGSNPFDKSPVEREFIDETLSCACNFIIGSIIALSISDIERPVEVLDIERLENSWCKTSMQWWGVVFGYAGMVELPQ